MEQGLVLTLHSNLLFVFMDFNIHLILGKVDILFFWFFFAGIGIMKNFDGSEWEKYFQVWIVYILAVIDKKNPVKPLLHGIKKLK